MRKAAIFILLIWAVAICISYAGTIYHAQDEYNVPPEVLAQIEAQAVPMPLRDPEQAVFTGWLPSFAEVAGYSPKLGEFRFIRPGSPDSSGKWDTIIDDPGETEHLPYKLNQVTNTTDLPWRTICKLYMHFSSGWYVCSGAFIVDNHEVFTAGHCLYDYGGDGWADQVIIVPGKNGASEPYGSKYGYDWYVGGGWSSSGSNNDDWGMIEVAPFSTGWMSNMVQSASWYPGKSFNTAGYPADDGYSGDEMWYDDGTCSSATSYRVTYNFNFSSYGKGTCIGGQSGSPVWYYDGSTRYIVSNITLTNCSGTKLRSDIVDFLNSHFVNLEDFSVKPVRNGVQIRWSTSYEENSAGWNLYRLAEGNDYVKLNDAIIPPYQYDYKYTDADVENSTKYCYKLEAVDLDGSTQLFGPKCATPEANNSDGDSAEIPNEDDNLDSLSATGGCGLL